MIKTDLSLPRGDSITYDHETKDENGNAFPLTGATMVFTVRNKVDGTIAFSLSSANAAQINIYDAAHGKAYIIIGNTHTQNLNIAQYQYDVQVKTAAGKIGTVSRGTLTITGDITRTT